MEKAKEFLRNNKGYKGLWVSPEGTFNATKVYGWTWIPREAETAEAEVNEQVGEIEIEQPKQTKKSKKNK